MSTINRIARCITTILNQSEEQYEIYVFSLNTWIHTILSIILTFVVAYIFSVLEYATIVGFTAYILRMFSGGSHSKSPFVCTGLSVIVVNIFALLAKFIYINNYILFVVIIIMLLVGIFILQKYAPVDNPNKPIISKTFKKQLKRKSYIFLIFCIVVSYMNVKTTEISLAIMLGLLWQLFTLTPLGDKTLKKIDLLF